jgi:hypothetical protein
MKKPWFDVVPLPPQSIDLNHKSRGILFLGSCFADEIGNRLIERKFDVLANPAGAIYNPLSIEALFLYMSGQLEWQKHNVIEVDSIWYSWDHHGAIRGDSIESLQKAVDQCHNMMLECLKKSELLTITLGTAYVFEKVIDGQIVANCHKAPGSLFQRRMLRVEDVVHSLESIYTIAKSIQPGLKLLLTLSPVRHLREGHLANQVSKSILRVAIHAFLEQYVDVMYFPSYEIALDELRDYRFYKEDRMHLSEEATDYIFDRFSTWSMSDETIALNEKIEKLQLAISHRPIGGQHSAAYQMHLQRTKEKIDYLLSEYPFLNFDNELANIAKLLQ